MRLRHRAARHNPVGTLGSAACIAGSVIALPVMLGLIVAVAIGERLRDRLPVPLLRLATWRKRRAWKRKHLPQDPYPFAGLTPGDHLTLSKYAGEIR